VWTALRYDAASTTEIRSRLRLRSTVPGANNRLDIQQIVSWDREEGQALPMMGAWGWVLWRTFCGRSWSTPSRS
jgi:F-box protein 9